MKTPEQLETDYQLGKKLQREGIIRTNWKIFDPRNLPGEKYRLYGHYAGNNKSFPDFVQKKGEYNGRFF